MTALALQSAALTDCGRVRDHNEDSWLVSADRRLLVVADGMGGHNAGEVAAGLCVDALEDLFQPPAGPRPWWRFWGPGLQGRARLRDALQRANRLIFDTSRTQAAYQGMGTTAVALWLDGPMLHHAHVGDSRLYRCRAGELAQLTRDHSLLDRFQQAGLVDAEGARQFPYKNVVMRALGLQPTTQVDTASIEGQVGDRFLLCSDGLTDLVDAKTILASLAADLPLKDIARSLVNAALEAGGADNVTVVVAQLELESAPPARTPG